MSMKPIHDVPLPELEDEELVVRSRTGDVGAFRGIATRYYSLIYTIESWTRNDPGSVSQWLQTLPTGASRENIADYYICEACHDSPELAAPWAETLTDDNRRYNAIERVAREWGRQDRAAAEAWLAKVNLPDERKQGLLNAFKLLR